MLRDHHQGVVVLKLLLFSGFITSALALAQFFLPRELTGAVFPPLLIDPRPFGTAGHPNWFGTYLVLLLPFAIHFLLKEWRWRWAVLVGLLHASLLVCQTRGAWLAEAVLIVFTVGIWRQDLKKLAGLFGILTLVTALLLPAHNWKILTRASSLAMEAELAASGSERAGSKRFGVWKYGLEHLPRYSLLGAGLDSFGALAEDGVEAPNSKAHSIYLEYALTTGIIGLLCYLGFLWRCFWTHAPPDFMWTFRTMLIAYLFQGIFIHDTVQTWPILWLLAGLCLGPLADGPDKAPERVRCSFAR